MIAISNAISIGLNRLGGGGPGPGPDPDAQAYFDRVSAAGGVLTEAEQTAVNQLVIDLKANSLWTPMQAIYPMVGASAAACAQNLKSSSFTGTFTSGWTFASTGVTGNGTSAYMNTGYNPSLDADTTINNFHHSVYINNGVVGNCIQGCYNAAGGETDILPVYGGAMYAMINNTGALGVANTTRIGHFIGSRYQLNSIQYYLSASQLLTTTSTPAASKNNLNYYIGLLNDNGNPTFGNASRIALSSLGLGLSPTQASDFYTAVQTFNQTLNRQVGAQIVSDADAQAYINRVYTAGGTLTNTEANAVNQLTIDMKAAGIWTPMKAIYPMVGASAAACAQNLKSSSFTGTFTSGWTFASTGVTPNGTSAYMNTGLIPSTSLTVNSSHASIYLNTNNLPNGVDPVDIGCFQNVLQSLTLVQSSLTLASRNVGNNITTTQATRQGFGLTSKTSATLTTLYKNGTNVVGGNSGGTLPSISIYIGGLNLNSSLYGASCTNNKIAFSSIGDGLLDAQASDFYTAVQAFQTTIGRAIAP